LGRDQSSVHVRDALLTYLHNEWYRGRTEQSTFHEHIIN